MKINDLLNLKEGFWNNGFLQFYTDNISEIVLALDLKLTVGYANNSFCRMIGLDNNSIVGKNLTQFLEKKDYEKISLLKDTPSEEQFKMEVRFKSVRNIDIFCEVRVYHFKNSIVMIGKDITEEIKIRNLRKNEIRKIEEEKARSEEILNSIGDGVVSVNDKGEIVYVNRQAVDILGFQNEELVGQLMWRKIVMIGQKHEEVEVEGRPIRLALFTRKRIYENSHFYKTKDGRLIPVAITATPLIVHGLVVGGVDVFRDITKEREVDRMKTEFISLASHQLRTPLSATKWFAELILDDSKDMNTEQIELIKNIYTSNQRMIDLVNALLNISRIESGRIIIDPKPTDLRKLVEDVILELTPKINEKKHSVVLSVHEGLPLISIDPKLIRNVYMNLLTNSIKYTKEGGEILIMVSKKENDVISQVSDNGLGIPENQKQRIFEKFFRSSNIVKVETDGTGLGLYLAKSIVESSGGKIWFESEEFSGTTFWFTLPLSGSDPKMGEVSIDS